MSEETKPSSKGIKWTAEKVMSISALFVSAISLFALFYQLNLAREENELIRKQQSASVLPHLAQWFSQTEDGFKIIFGNKGVGPAFIREVKLELKDTTFYNTDHLMSYLAKKLYEKDSIAIDGSTSTFSAGYVLPANETIEITKIADLEFAKKFRSFLQTVELDYTVTYADVYGAEWTLSNKDNDSSYPIPKQ